MQLNIILNTKLRRLRRKISVHAKTIKETKRTLTTESSENANEGSRNR